MMISPDTLFKPEANEKPTEFPKLNIAVSSTLQNSSLEFGILANSKPPDAYFYAPPVGKMACKRHTSSYIYL